jgi:hypothetical protein
MARAVAWRKGDGDGLAALADDGQRAVPSLQAERFDVRPDGCGYPQPVERQQRHQGVLGRGAQASREEQGSDFVAVQADGVRLVVDAGTADVDGRGVGDEAFLLGVAVEAGHRAQPSGDRGRRPTVCLQLASERLDVAAADLEQLEVPSGRRTQRTGAGPGCRRRG